MINEMNGNPNDYMGKMDFVWWHGVVEDINDPLKLGRCKVRVIGLHTHDVAKLPTDDLPWATPMQPITSAALSGIGTTPLGLVEGTNVVVMFQDEDKQYPIILGSIGGIPQSSSGDVSVDDSTIKIKIDGELKEANAQSGVLLDSSGNGYNLTSIIPTTSLTSGTLTISVSGNPFNYQTIICIITTRTAPTYRMSYPKS